MAQAYDFALDKMGLDIQSFSLWSDYIKFLKVQIALFIASSLIILILSDFWPSSNSYSHYLASLGRVSTRLGISLKTKKLQLSER